MEIKSLEEFHNQAAAKDGKQRRCKSCVSLHTKNNKESNRKKANKWLNQNKEKAKVIAKKTKKKYRAKHTERENLRRAAKKRQTPDISKLEKAMIRGLYLIREILSNSCGEEYHVDHIVPICKGGAHVFDNLQIITAKENLKKGGRHE